jgi:hypothetical protein
MLFGSTAAQAAAQVPVAADNLSQQGRLRYFPETSQGQGTFCPTSGTSGYTRRCARHHGRTGKIKFQDAAPHSGDIAGARGRAPLANAARVFFGSPQNHVVWLDAFGLPKGAVRCLVGALVPDVSGKYERPSPG